MQAESLPRHLEGAFVIGTQEDAGRAAVVGGSLNDAGVNHLTAGDEGVRLALWGEPGAEVACLRRQVGEDVCGVCQDVGDLVGLHPNPVQAAGGVAFIQRAAAQGFGLQQAGGGFHAADCNTPNRRNPPCLSAVLRFMVLVPAAG